VTKSDIWLKSWRPSVTASLTRSAVLPSGFKLIGLVCRRVKIKIRPEKVEERKGEKARNEL